ncbi:hypothetical protein [Bradyrhizobium sp. RT6a]|uniref:hypothetical protein n=1 Tax=unclassified Bradyrhizobium TaxID=2631580 RepID=UPI003398DA18
MRTSPAIVPADRLDPTSTLCSKTSARVPAAHDETDKADTDLEAVLQGLLSGQYAYQVRIVCFNAIEGWSRDATSDVADALARRTVDNDEEPARPRGFHQRQREQALGHTAHAAAEGRRSVMFREGKAEGPAPESERHFIRCPICDKASKTTHRRQGSGKDRVHAPPDPGIRAARLLIVGTPCRSSETPHPHFAACSCCERLDLQSVTFPDELARTAAEPPTSRATPLRLRSVWRQSRGRSGLQR